jgi:LmbE family N-acetylglucosaminyl deacetylase
MTNLHAELRQTPEPLEIPSRVLTIGAHPDDAEFGAGATLARWAAGGTDVTMCVVTDGSKGSWDPSEDTAALVARRRVEQQAAAHVLGVTTVVHLDHVDGELEATMDLRREIARQIRAHRPEVVMSHDPWQRYQLHPDHRATGLAAVDGVVDAREPLALRGEELPAHRPAALLLWSADEPDHAEPVEPEWFARKVEALLCHASQAQTTMADAGADEERTKAFEKQLAAWQDAAGTRLGTGPAETFKRITP